MRSTLSVIVLLWLLIGVFACYQRDYFTSNNEVVCKRAGDIVLTVIAGPLNYVGANPKIDCDFSVPQPST